VHNISIVFVRLVVGALLSFYVASYLAQELGPVNNGLYALTVLLPTMAVTFGGFGFSTAVVYFISKKNYPLSEVLAKLILVSAISSLLIVGLCFSLPVHLWNTWLPSVPMYLIATGIAIIPLLLLYTNFIAILHGQQNFRKYGLISMLPNVVTVVLLQFFSGTIENRLLFCVIAWGIGYLPATILIAFYLRSDLLSFFKHVNLRSGLLREAFVYGLKSYAGNLITFLNYRLNFYLIGGMIGANAVGIFAVTVPITEVIWLLAAAVSTVIFPLIAHQSSSDGSVKNPTPIISRWVFVASCLAGLIIGELANFIVLEAFGPLYSEAVEAIHWLLPGVVLFSVSKVLSGDIAGRGRPDINLYITSLSLVINIMLCYLLIPMYGINGGAMAVSITYCFYTLVVSVIYSKLVDVHISEMFLPKYSDWHLLRKLFNKFLCI
jgi:O-antigen/teichoic acid export membrane protein